MSWSMKSGYNLLLGAVVAMSAAACADGTGPEVAAEMRASISVLKDTQMPNGEAGILPFTPTITAGVGTVEILGQIRLPTPCYTLSSELLSANRVITLNVKAESSLSQGSVCAQVLVVRDYGATIQRIPAGRYTVRVVHLFPGTSRTPDVVAEKEVDVR